VLHDRRTRASYETRGPAAAPVGCDDTTAS